MTLRIRTLRLHNFRNYEDMTLDDVGDLMVFAGPNAVGKTNLMEAIQLVTALESFRSPTTDKLMRWDTDAAWVQADLADGNRNVDIRMVLDSRGRHYRVNGKQRPRKDVGTYLPAVFFSPDDLQLVKGGSEKRRAAIDAVGAQVSRNYSAVKRDYDKLLRQKNRLLKEDVVPGYLDSVNEVLARIGSQLLLYRLRVLRALREQLPQRHRDIAGGGAVLSIEYRPTILPDGDDLLAEGGCLSDEGIAACLADRQLVEQRFHEQLHLRGADETVRHTSLVGPHRDAVNFTLGGRPATDFASQGQQRSIAIAMKLSELDIIRGITGNLPILLLDDVMSELDASRRELLTRYVKDAAQTFISTTNLDYFTPELLEAATVVRLGR